MPSATSGKTLAERAQRLLGLNLDKWLAEELRSGRRAAPTSRSEQVAEAQRKHRQRTQSYIQALEEEVLRLRGVELALRGELEVLRKPLPSQTGPPQDSPVNSLPDAVGANVSNGKAAEKTVVVNWGEFYQATPEAACCISAAETTPPEVSWPVGNGNAPELQPPSATWVDTCSEAALSQSKNSSPEKGEATEAREPLSCQKGVDYILRLEKPCLAHLKHATVVEPMRREGDVEVPYNWGTNHAYNLSTRLFHEHRSLSPPQDTEIGSGELEGLLQASERLQLSDELTPVQVWAMVSKLNKIFPIDAKLVDDMFNELSKYSYCNSFGTALSKETVKAAFQHFLGLSNDMWEAV
ncbi:hypothetical protein GQ53DRAFT_835311 [Thozetella sp. PMI_491]|nr:hypothetical protein GQ53DRAFT_835311 [Thozetella sp. PMI_491]